MVSFLDFLRHEKQPGKWHDDSTDAHGYPPEWTDLFGVPYKNTWHRTACLYTEFEFKEYRCDSEEVYANERIHKTRTT
jgi:hypothetical protein